MDDLVIILSNSKPIEANEITSSLERNNNIKVQTVLSQGFMGVGEIIVIISAFGAALGGEALLKELAEIMVAWMKRYEGRRVKIGKVDITGYSAEEVERILKAYEGK